MKEQILLGVLCTMILSPHIAWAENQWLSDKFKSFKDSQLKTITKTSLSDTKIGAGLKEALKVGIQNAIAQTGKPDGFFKNPAIKINLPESLSLLDKGLRMMGQGQKIDDFVLNMNRSAEKAVPLASNVFLDAVFAMTIEDGQKILNGAPNAATLYLKEKTGVKLKEALAPIVKKVLTENNLVKKYQELVAGYAALPFSKKKLMFDPEDYVLNKTLDGLFLVLGEEEAKIRKDPSARVTDLLKEVFK